MGDVLVSGLCEYREERCARWGSGASKMVELQHGGQAKDRLLHLQTPIRCCWKTPWMPWRRRSAAGGGGEEKVYPERAPPPPPPAQSLGKAGRLAIPAESNHVSLGRSPHQPGLAVELGGKSMTELLDEAPGAWWNLCKASIMAASPRLQPSKGDLLHWD